MKKFYYFFVLFTILFEGSFITSLSAMEETRRLENYSSIEEYFSSFEHGRNQGKPKILIIGGGLTYDDLVPNSHKHFLTSHDQLDLDQSTYHRIKHYPSNAYLIDYEGTFDYNPKVKSHSDSHADITHPVGSTHGLPNHFINQFDVIILENVELKALTGEAFKNIYSLLKIGGKIVSNIYFEVSIKNIDLLKQAGIKRKNFLEAPMLDQENNVLTCLFYPAHWVEEDESLFQNSHYIISPISDQNDVIYKHFQGTHEKKIISFQKFENKYETNSNYKIFIINKVEALYKQNIHDYFGSLISDAKLSFTHEEELWCGPIPQHGYFVISKTG